MRLAQKTQPTDSRPERIRQVAGEALKRLRTLVMRLATDPFATIEADHEHDGQPAL